MPSLNTLSTGHHILVWRGRGGRRVLVNFLQENGVTVDAIAWYQRRCPIDALDKFTKLQQQLVTLSAQSEPIAPITLISSGEAFTNWRMLFAEWQTDRMTSTDAAQLSDFDYLTFGKRLTDTLQDLQLNCMRIEHLDDNEVWQGIQRLINN